MASLSTASDASLAPPPALLSSIAAFLSRVGYEKTLAALKSEAGVKKSVWRLSSINLEDLFKNTNGVVSDDQADHSLSNKDGLNSVENKSDGIKGKKRKRQNDLFDTGAKVDQKFLVSEEDNDCLSQERTNNGERKSKKKSNEQSGLQNDSDGHQENQQPEYNKNEKRNKKKKTVDSLPDEPSQQDVNGNTRDIIEETAVTEKLITGEKKDSKRRKKSKEAEVGRELRVEVDAAENKNVPSNGKTDSTVHLQEHDDRKEVTGYEIDNDSSRSAKAQSNPSKSSKMAKYSAEAKTIVPFQRVKIEEVKFVDERLQDNSYWAKDGADSGYGAKAQEVLGQVRGRDFRHEKTKKKRGSYRGGLIDLESHSIKFNCSDEE